MNPRHATRAQLAYRAIRHKAAKKAKQPATIPVGEATEVDFAEFLAARGAAS